MVQLIFNTLYKNEEKIRNYLKDKKYKELSIASYFTSLKRLYKLIDNDISIQSMLADNNKLFDLVTETIDKIEAKTSKNTVINGFINVFSAYNDLLHINKKSYNFDDLIEHLTNTFKSMSKKINEERTYMKPTKSEKENHMTMKQIIELRDQYKRACEEYTEFYPRCELKYLILCLYTYMPPLRGQDWFTCKVYDTMYIMAMWGVLPTRQIQAYFKIDVTRASTSNINFDWARYTLPKPMTRS